MGHADAQTTMKYVHYVPRPDDAALVAEAFKVEPAVSASTGRLMAETPDPVARLDDYLATVTYVHEAIWELRTAAVVVGRDDARVHEWFREAAELVVVELPPILREARRLRELWSEQEVLDPAAATETLN